MTIGKILKKLSAIPFFIFGSPQKTSTSNNRTTGSTTHTDTAHSNGNHGEVVSNKSTWGTIWNIVGIIGIIIATIAILTLIFRPTNPKSSPPPVSSAPSSRKEVLEEIDRSIVGPGTSWITPQLNFNARFRTNGHSIWIRYTSKTGGWTERVFQDKDRDFERDGPLPIPSNTADPNGARAIFAQITAGPDETTEFTVWLLRKR